MLSYSLHGVLFVIFVFNWIIGALFSSRVRSRLRRLHQSTADRAGLTGDLFDNSLRRSFLFFKYTMTGKHKELNDKKLNQMVLAMKLLFFSMCVLLVLINVIP